MARKVSVSLFRRDGRTYVSICRTAASPRPDLATPEELQARLPALLTRWDREGAAARLELLRLSGLGGAERTLGAESGAALRRELGVQLNAASLEGAPASEVTPDRFALVVGGDAEAAELARGLEDIGRRYGVSLGLRRSAVSLARELRPEITVRALRVALAAFTDQEPDQVTASLGEVIARTLERSVQLRTTLGEGRLELVYQPIVDMVSQAPHHFEALVRLSGGSAPESSIRLAEELGVVAEMDFAVLRGVLAELRRLGASAPRVAMNVSALTVGHADYAATVLSELRLARVEPRRLMIELTETAPVADLGAVALTLETLRRAGISVCLDDVGVGACSFGYLRRLPFDYLKLDGSLITDIQSCVRTRRIVAHLSHLGREMDATVVAERVETIEQTALLRTMGVRLGQGWLFGKPGPLAHRPANADAA